MNCGTCGRKLKKGQTVCPHCGAAAGGNQADYGFSGAEEQFASSEDRFDQGFGGDFSSDGPTRVYAPRRRGGGKLLLIIAAAVLVLAAAAALLLIPKNQDTGTTLRGFAAPTGQWEWIDRGRSLLTNELLVIMEEEKTQRDLEKILEPLEGVAVGYLPEIHQFQVRFNTQSRSELEKMKSSVEGAEGVLRADWHLVIHADDASLISEAGPWPAGEGETIGLLGALIPAGDEKNTALSLPSLSFPDDEQLQAYLASHPDMPEARNGAAAEQLAAGRNVIAASCFYLEENPDGTFSRYTTTGAIRYQIAQLVRRGARVIAVPVHGESEIPAETDSWLPAEAEQTQMLYEALEKEAPNFLISKSASVLSDQYIADGNDVPSAGDFLSGMLRGKDGSHLLLTVCAGIEDQEKLISALDGGMGACLLEGWTDCRVDFAVEHDSAFYGSVLTGLRAARQIGITEKITREEIVKNLMGEASGIACETGRKTAFYPLLRETAGSGVTAEVLGKCAAVHVSAKDGLNGAAVKPVLFTIDSGSGENGEAADGSAWILTGEGQARLKAKADGYLETMSTIELSAEERAKRTAEKNVEMTGENAGNAGSVTGSIRFPEGNAGKLQLRCMNSATGRSLEADISAAYSIRLPAGTYDLTFFGPDLVPVTLPRIIVSAGQETALPEIEIARSSDLPGTISGHITDALTGNSMDGVQLDFYSGVDAADIGTPAATVLNGGDGNYTARLRAGAYTVKASKNGYISVTRNVFVQGEKSSANQNFALSPMLPEGQVRIVLEWGEKPKDLDSHLVNQTQGVHVFYSVKTASGPEPVNLDVDDTSSYGPETTTIPKQYPGRYTFYVHDYTNSSSTNSSAMAQSGAKVTVYLGNNEQQVFEVPNQPGTLWEVFHLENGVITPSGRMTYHSNAGSVGQ